MDNEAVPVNAPSFSPVVPEAASEPEIAITDRERSLAGLFDNPDWGLYEQVVRERLQQIRQLRGIDMAGKNNDEIGQMFRVANLAADEIEVILLKVRESWNTLRAHERRHSTT